MSNLLAPVVRGVRSAGRRIGRMYRLTAAFCRRAGPGRHADGGCLYLKVRRTGTKGWVLLVTIDGRRREYGLGPYPIVTLAHARELAAEYMSRIVRGLDPRGSGSRQAPTVREALEAVIGDLARNWTAAGAVQKYRRAAERHIFPLLGGKRVDEVTVDDCYAIVHPKWRGRGSLGFTIRHQLSHLMKWACAQGYRDDNPAELVLNRLPKIKARPNHQPSLPYSRMRKALAALAASDEEPVVKSVIVFLVLTAARLREATEARWSEFDLDRALWTVPKGRMKKRREHRVPLSEQALRILAELGGPGSPGDLVFGRRRGRGPARPVSSAEISRVLRRLGLTDLEDCPVVAHGFRSTFTDWAGDNVEGSEEAAEAALAHAAATDTRRAYRRNDLLKARRPLMQKWADYVLPEAGE